MLEGRGIQRGRWGWREGGVFGFILAGFWRVLWSSWWLIVRPRRFWLGWLLR